MTKTGPGALGADLPVMGLLALPLAACNGGTAAPTEGRTCDGIPEEMGGCDPSRPVFTGTTCDSLAEEWVWAIDTGVTAVIDGPKDVDGEGRSVRISSVLIVASVSVGMRMHDLGLLEECDVPEFLLDRTGTVQARPGHPGPDRPLRR